MTPAFFRLLLRLAFAALWALHVVAWNWTAPDVSSQA
jgi:hypothetical protein